VLGLGCGGKFPSRVSGVVRVDGAPAKEGTVSFEPVGPGMMASGKISSDGTYVLKSNADLGLAPGEYVAMLDIREAPIWPKNGGLPMPGKLKIPEQYARTETSGLNFTVEPGSNSIDIEISTQAGK
jgi:hypothetical protein